MRYSPEPLSNATDAGNTAEDFAALFRHVLVATIAVHAPYSLRPRWRDPWHESRWMLAATDARGEPVPIALRDGTWLFAAQTLGVRTSDRDGRRWLTTLAYKYRWQADESDQSWIMRWEYYRERSGRYPAAHLHVNAAPQDFQPIEKPFHKLHIPPGHRIAIEDVVAFLVRDHGIDAEPGWGDVLAEASAIFGRIQGREG